MPEKSQISSWCKKQNNQNIHIIKDALIKNNSINTAVGGDVTLTTESETIFNDVWYNLIDISRNVCTSDRSGLSNLLFPECMELNPVKLSSSLKLLPVV